MVTRIAIFLILASSSFAQTVTTYDSRTNGLPVAGPYVSVDIGVTDKNANPDYQSWFRSFPAPALIDTQLGIGVSIITTLKQAEIDLGNLSSNNFPAIVRQRGKDVKQESRKSAQNAANANSVPALRDEVKRVAELIEQLQERMEKVERQFQKSQ